MPTNYFVPVAAAAGANVTSDAAWDGSSFQVTGVTKGIVPSAGMNKAWRQGTMGTSALGQIIVDHGLIDAVDDGNVPGLKANLRTAIAAMLAGVAFAVDQSSTANQITAILDPAPPSLSTYRGIFVRVANTNTGPVALTLNNLGTKNVVRRSGAALVAGDIVAGQFIHLIYDVVTAQWVAAGALNSDTSSLAVATVNAAKTSLYYSPGTFTWVCPQNITRVSVRGRGGGGGGGGSTGAGTYGAGGGSGGSYFQGTFAVSPNTAYSIIVGAGGSGGSAAGSNGGGGGATSFGALATAPGGNGGSVANGATPNGPGGVPPANASGGQFQFGGTSGGLGIAVAGAGTGGSGGGSYMMSATNLAPIGNGQGYPGQLPGIGGNGGGGNDFAGGTGGPGELWLEY